jgi:hypothetical protein
MPRTEAEGRLEQLKREVGRELRKAAKVVGAPLPARRKLRARDFAAAGAIALARITVIVALPFLVYVRTSVFLYSHGAAAWLAIAGAMTLTMALVALYGAWLSRRVKGRARVKTIVRWVGVPIVAVWCLSALFYLARVNAKTDEVHGYYLSVHPIMRVALSTVILIDPDLVVTDMARKPQDYVRMGLPINERTKHYEQPDGWVHAIDLRTRGHSEIANRLVQFYFWSMGFSTLRHVGTADHLHVQLRTRT